MDNKKQFPIKPGYLTGAFLNFGKDQDYEQGFSKDRLQNSPEFKPFFDKLNNLYNKTIDLNSYWRRLTQRYPNWKQTVSSIGITPIQENKTIDESLGAFLAGNVLAAGLAYFKTKYDKSNFQKDAKEQIDGVNQSVDAKIMTIESTLEKIRDEINGAISSQPRTTNESLKESGSSAYGNVGFDVNSFQKRVDSMVMLYNNINTAIKAIRTNLGQSPVTENTLKESVPDSTVITSYTHFAVNKGDGRIYYGWDYSDVSADTLKDDVEQYFASDLRADGKNPKDYKIVTRGYLKNRGIDAGDIESAWGE